VKNNKKKSKNYEENIMWRYQEKKTHREVTPDKSRRVKHKFSHLKKLQNTKQGIWFSRTVT
jgi:hypothetical protein